MNGPWRLDPSRDTGSLDALLALAGVVSPAAARLAVVEENLALSPSTFIVDTHPIPSGSAIDTHTLYRLDGAKDEQDPWLGAVQTRFSRPDDLTQVSLVKTRPSDLAVLTVVRQLAANDTQLLVYTVNLTLTNGTSAACVRSYVRGRG